MGSSSNNNASAKRYISGVQQVFQKQVLGTNDCPSQWKLKWSNTVNGIKIDIVQVHNQTSTKIVKNIDKVIEASVVDEVIRSKLIIASQHYTHAMELLLLHRALEEEEKELSGLNR